jgi:hypothetical protein
MSFCTHYAIDGIDITPALKGGHLDREAIFTYFPHSPPAPDWLPPSISVHRGDWKLIRLFHQEDDGQHDYLLYDLKEDLRETNNLASVHPEIVRRLDALIDQRQDISQRLFGVAGEGIKRCGETKASAIATFFCGRFQTRTAISLAAEHLRPPDSREYSRISGPPRLPAGFFESDPLGG